jgi:hypothetical protein
MATRLAHLNLAAASCGLNGTVFRKASFLARRALPARCIS